MKKVLVISTSLRADSNSELLAEEFARGALSAGHSVEKLSLRGKQLAFCKGCLACQGTQKCVIDDDAVELAKKMQTADVIAFATPVYYYGMSGQMKTLLDRANPMYSTDYLFRDVYLLATAAEDEAETVEGTVAGVQCWLSCYEKARLAGVIFAGNVNDAGDIKGHPALSRAFEVARSI